MAAILPSLLAIDQGTTSSRAILFDQTGQALRSAQQEFPQIFPQDGWVEHDPETIWQGVLSVSRDVLAKSPADRWPLAIGITNQRETTVIWERKSGKPIYNAIVWQDRRGADLCRRLEKEGHEPLLQERTGLLADSYFSASKITWLLDHVEGARAAAERGELAFGTVDCFLLWRLTGGRVHATDATNAARTLLYNISSGDWDTDLLKLFGVPASLLPEVKDCAGEFGVTEPAIFGRSLPVTGMAGDQQAALIGQACFDPGMIKSTYGTGCFVIANCGKTRPPRSRNRLLTTIGYRRDGEVTYAQEGSIFIAGAAIQWLRDGLRIITSAQEAEELAKNLTNNRGVYMVPAFTGLGAPYWDASARGALFGLARDTGRAEIARAALEAVCYQTRDLLEALAADAIPAARRLRVDGGMAANNWLMEFLAGILGIPVERPKVTETTALGAAFLAGLGIGLYPDLDAIRAHWQQDRNFHPKLDAAQREKWYDGWKNAVARVATDRQ